MPTPTFTEVTKFGLAMRFTVIVGGMDLGGWHSCTGLNIDFGLKELRSGGENEHAVFLPDQIKYQRVKLKRAMSAHESPQVLTWMRKMKDQENGDSLTITLRDSHNQPVCEWELRNARPSKWTGPALESTQNKVAIEELELAHEGFL
jgi:phage tail-like protein